MQNVIFPFWNMYIKRLKTTLDWGFYLFHLCFLGEDGSYINAVEATSQYSYDQKIEDEADDINSTPLFAVAICYFLLDPLLLQIRLGIFKKKKQF